MWHITFDVENGHVTRSHDELRCPYSLPITDSRLLQLSFNCCRNRIVPEYRKPPPPSRPNNTDTDIHPVRDLWIWIFNVRHRFEEDYWKKTTTTVNIKLCIVCVSVCLWLFKSAVLKHNRNWERWRSPGGAIRMSLFRFFERSISSNSSRMSDAKDTSAASSPEAASLGGHDNPNESAANTTNNEQLAANVLDARRFKYVWCDVL